jgi:hypothetical protein
MQCKCSVMGSQTTDLYRQKITIKNNDERKTANKKYLEKILFSNFRYFCL